MDILIVEDEPKLGQLLIDYLRAASYAPTLISHGDQVLPYVRQTPPDLILLDLMLPGTDGLTLCREIRRFSDVPIVMVTAKIEEIDRLLGLEIGADDYICKPYSPREVVARVKTILRRCKPQRELQVLDALTHEISLRDGQQLPPIALPGLPRELRSVEDHVNRLPALRTEGATHHRGETVSGQRFGQHPPRITHRHVAAACIDDAPAFARLEA